MSRHDAPDPATTTPPLQTVPTVEGFELGPYATNCYLASVPGSGDCWIIDAGFGPRGLLDRVRSRGLRPTALILTHAHVDHLGGIADVLARHPGLPIYLHEAEHAWLGDPVLNLSAAMGVPVTIPGPARPLRDGDRLELAGTFWKVLHVPGHSPGGVALVHGESGTALVGDALFAGSIGRTDLPGGNFETLAAAIRRKLYTLPEGTRIYPGHGPPSTIGEEKRTNPFVKGR